MDSLLSICDIKEDVSKIIDLACDIKAGKKEDKPLEGKTLAMVFQKSSTRIDSTLVNDWFCFRECFRRRDNCPSRKGQCRQDIPSLRSRNQGRETDSPAL